MPSKFREQFRSLHPLKKSKASHSYAMSQESQPARSIRLTNCGRIELTTPQFCLVGLSRRRIQLNYQINALLGSDSKPTILTSRQRKQATLLPSISRSLNSPVTSGALIKNIPLTVPGESILALATQKVVRDLPRSRKRTSL